MNDKSESDVAQGLHDTRSRSRGWPVVFMALLALGAVVFAWRGIISVTDSAMAGDYASATVTVVAVLAWILGTAGVIHNGRRMRVVALVFWIVNLLGATVGIFLDTGFVRINPWFNGGATYFFLPTVGSVLAIAWLYWSAPANVASRGASS